MHKSRLEAIDAHLEQARYIIDGVMNCREPAQAGMDSLCRAMEEMVAEWKIESAAAAHAASRLSCLENGITPD
jgi:hypothetical protein